MGRVIGLVAYHVFKESVRDKVLYNLVLFAILLISASNGARTLMSRTRSISSTDILCARWASGMPARMRLLTR